MLMRDGRIWRNTYWTGPHGAWSAAQSFDEPALVTALAHYRATLATRETELACIESELAPWARQEPLAGPVGRLCCYRGIAELNGLTLAAEVVDWRRVPPARALTGFTRRGPAPYPIPPATCRAPPPQTATRPPR